MWIVADFGYFSVVAHRDKPGHLLVRARVRADLEALAGRLWPAPKIVTTPDADYRYRMLVPAEAFAAVMADAVKAIDYPNFKDQVAERQGSERAHVYLGIWDHLRRRLQRSEPTPFRKASVGYED
jgi:hypothetical protein